MSNGYALPFHNVDAHGSSIQQHISHMIVQKINLVNVEDAAISGCENAGLQRFYSFFYGPFHVQRSYHPIFGCSQRQIDYRGLFLYCCDLI